MKSRILDLQVDAADLFSALCENCDDAFLLESSEGTEKTARFSFLGFSPKKKMSLSEGVVTVGDEERQASCPIDEIKKEVDSTKDGSEGFVGGAVGYFSFDYIRYVEGLLKKKPGPFPDYEFGIFDDAIVYDHRKSEMKYLHRGEDRIDELLRHARDASFENGKLEVGKPVTDMSKEEYCKGVGLAKERILAGDIFQVVLSRRYEMEYSGGLLSFYKRLKVSNPSPYMYFLKFGKKSIIGSSPENLVRIEGQNISSYATLAGTRKRGANRQEDAALEKELLSDEKELAEHIMLVDLTRNDLGKVSRPGTVRVPELMNVHKYSHVQHIASLVTGKLREDKDCYDALDAIFPAGTVSGAPKKKAIEIIDEIEKSQRGPYAGAVGYFSANGNADFAIGIRTLCADGKKAYVQAGAGIVHESVPENEYMETENKGKALMRALGRDDDESPDNR
jgi:anthranilate synthase component 1